MKKRRLALIAIAFGICGANNSYAHDSVGFSLNIGAPAYYYEPPVYYVPPPPVYYSRPAVLMPAEPVYYESYAPRAFFRNDDWRLRHGHNGWRKHHSHDDD